MEIRCKYCLIHHKKCLLPNIVYYGCIYQLYYTWFDCERGIWLFVIWYVIYSAWFSENYWWSTQITCKTFPPWVYKAQSLSLYPNCSVSEGEMGISWHILLSVPEIMTIQWKNRYTAHFTELCTQYRCWGRLINRNSLCYST